MLLDHVELYPYTMHDTFNVTDDRTVGDGPSMRTGFLDLPYEL